MVSLTNPVTAQNLIDRFCDYVVATANANIIWGTNNIPFTELSSSYFGGTTAGKATSISATGTRGTIITAKPIYDAILADTFRYSNIRLMRAILNVTVTGGYPWNRSGGPRYAPAGATGVTAGDYITIYDQTQKAHLSTAYIYTTDANRLARGQPQTGAQITRAGLEDLFDRARTLYNDFYDDTLVVSVRVCHASCHGSCHSSRVRR